MQILGSKKGASQPKKPHIAKDDLVSTDYYKGLYGLCEGEIFGLSDGGKSIKLDGTPLINANGQPNFKGVTWDFRSGTLDQSHIAGFPAIENEQNIGVELRHDRPYTKAINNKELSAVRVRLNLNALREQKDNGDIVGYAIEHAIDVQTDTGAFVEVLRQTIRGKASSGFKRSHRIDLPPAKKGWTIRIRRITPNRDSDLVADTMTVDAITEIIDAKLAYPCTALLGLSYDAKTFNNIAKLSVRLKGKIIQVPTNYNADARTYNGLWDGTFKLAYSNNPAWVFYDLCTHKRYGLGERLNGMVDKWRLYQIGQYCDELVDDGKGGKEPRFTVNVYIQQADDAYKVLQNLASVFRGMSFWDGSNIVVDSDTPKEAVYTFSPANVVGGEFSYTGTRARDRHTAVKVAWDNPDNEFKTEYEAVQDEEGIATQGLRMLDMNAFGCTSRGQAMRAGLWALKSEQLETRSVTFKTGLQGFIPQVGEIINIADNVFAGRAISGRIVSVNGKQITLDRVAGKVGDTLTIATADGIVSSTIIAINDKIVIVNQALNVANDSIWAIVADDLNLMQFRILSIAQNDDATFSIHALQYEPQKFDAVDNGVHITQEPYSVLKATPITAPNSVSLTSSNRTVQGQAVTMLTINWEQVQGATAYIVKWRKDDGNWQTLPRISGQSVDIDGIYAGNYLAQVQAVDSFDNESLATTSQLTQITGKQGKPPRLAKLVVKGILFGMQIDWIFAKGSDDTNFTEIQVSPDGRSNITTLGTFAYPTNKYEITGLQGGLTQFYRGRIVDKLGNASDWTAWTKGVTDASADKVLDLLNGQITQSQLHQDLATPIAKIGTLENGVNGLTAQISADKNRLSSAISDINELMRDKNAKTAELASLTQRVGNSESSVREIAVTTGNLSQKYSELKSISDTVSSKINRIEQTTGEQALAVNKLESRLITRPNLCPDVDKWVLGTGFFVNKDSDWGMVLKTHVGDTRVCLSPKIAVRAGGSYVLTYDSLRLAVAGEIYCDLQGYNDKNEAIWDSYQQIRSDNHDFSTTNSNRERNAIEYKIPNGVVVVQVRFVCQSIVGTDVALGVRQVKLEYGSLPATIYTQEADTNELITKTGLIRANLDEYKQTQATKDLAISQRIDSLSTTMQQADNHIKADLLSEQTARTNADNALSQRIDSLTSDYNGNKATIASQLKTLADKEQAISQRTDSLNASFNDVNNRIKTRVNLLPNGGFENGLTGWIGDFVISEHPTFGRVAYLNAVTQKTGAQVLHSDKFACEAGRVYTISADTALNGSGQVYVDLLFYNRNGQMILDGNQNKYVGVHDFAVVSDRHEISSQAPDGAVAMVARFVIENLSNATYVAVRQIKVEAGQLPSTPYSADTLGKVLTASINDIRQTVATANQATAQKLSQLESNLGTKANSSALDTLSTKVNQVDGKLTAEAQKFSTLQTTVNGQTSSIQTHAQSIDGLKAQYTVKVDSGGRVAGIGLASGGGVSDFSVRADKFLIAPPSGNGKGDSPFMVLTTPTNINGTVIPSGTYIKDAYIANGSIDVAKINKASITSLSALSANIGTLTTTDSRGTFTYTGSKIELRDPQGRLLLEMGLL